MAKTKEALGKKEGYHHGNLKEALVNAAVGILETEGLKALSLRGVARKVGVSQTAPYHHFKDKEGLLAAVAAQGFKMMAAHQEASKLDGADSVTRLKKLGRGYVTFGLEHPALLQLMFGPEITEPSAHAELSDMGQKGYQAIFSSVEARMKEEDLAYVSPSVATLAAWSMVHGLSTLLIGGKITPQAVGAKNEDDLIEQVANVLLRGLS